MQEAYLMKKTLYLQWHPYNTSQICIWIFEGKFVFSIFLLVRMVTMVIQSNKQESAPVHGSYSISN